LEILFGDTDEASEAMEMEILAFDPAPDGLGADIESFRDVLDGQQKERGGGHDENPPFSLDASRAASPGACRASSRASSNNEG